MLPVRPMALGIALTAVTCFGFAAHADELSGADAFHNKIFARETAQNSSDASASAVPVRSGMESYYAFLTGADEPLGPIASDAAK
ncbi:MAG TPA: hypothetical protein VH020_15270 [Stellaceae bacterium]|jgi:hypothetical protein|nr:hypothetical protein [Stellaceae bacterium]